MVKKFSDDMSTSLLENKIIQVDDIEVCSYGLQLLLYDMISFSLLFILSFIFDALLLNIIFLLTFVPLRSFTGGYHAKTFFKCLSLTLSTFTIIIFSCKYVPAQIQIILGLIFSFFSTIMIFTKTPIVNANRPKTLEQVAKSSYISKFILFFILFFLFLFYSLGGEFIVYFFDISLSITAISLSALVVLKKGGESNEH